MIQGEAVGVDCTFSAENTIHIHRIQLSSGWIPVTQGRHWHDNDGFHALVLPPANGDVIELVLKRETLDWTATVNRPHRDIV